MIRTVHDKLCDLAHEDRQRPGLLNNRLPSRVTAVAGETGGGAEVSETEAMGRCVGITHVDQIVVADGQSLFF
jgi:hypothetical protein